MRGKTHMMWNSQSFLVSVHNLMRNNNKIIEFDTRLTLQRFLRVVSFKSSKMFPKREEATDENRRKEDK